MERTNLAGEVDFLLLILLQGDGILEKIISAIVGLAGSLDLGDRKLLLGLLGKVLVESEGVVLFLLLLAWFGLSIGGGSLTLSDGGDFSFRISLGSLLLLQLGVALIASPALVNLLLGVAGDGYES